MGNIFDIMNEIKSIKGNLLGYAPNCAPDRVVSSINKTLSDIFVNSVKVGVNEMQINSVGDYIELDGKYYVVRINNDWYFVD